METEDLILLGGLGLLAYMALKKREEKKEEGKAPLSEIRPRPYMPLSWMPWRPFPPLPGYEPWIPYPGRPLLPLGVYKLPVIKR